MSTKKCTNKTSNARKCTDKKNGKIPCVRCRHEAKLAKQEMKKNAPKKKQQQQKKSPTVLLNGNQIKLNLVKFDPTNIVAYVDYHNVWDQPEIRALLIAWATENNIRLVILSYVSRNNTSASEEVVAKALEWGVESLVVYHKRHKALVMQRALESGVYVIVLLDDQFRNLLPALKFGMRGIHCLQYADPDYRDSDRQASSAWIKENGPDRLWQVEDLSSLKAALAELIQ